MTERHNADLSRYSLDAFPSHIWIPFCCRTCSEKQNGKKTTEFTYKPYRSDTQLKKTRCWEIRNHANT